MATLINSIETNVVFVNKGVIFNSIPSPSISIYLHTSAALRIRPYELCNFPVGLRWPTLAYDIKPFTVTNDFTSYTTPT
jgi:hypothetical protein